LYGKLRPYLNKVARPSFEGICSTDILVFSSSPLIDNNFLKHRLRATDVVKYADQNSSGINLPRISPDDLGEFEIGLPPLPEQRRIADRLDAIQSRTQATGETLDQVPDRIEEYRQSVLNAAFTGRLTADWRADHPDVEPADKLLECILNERRKQWEKYYRWSRYDSKGKEPPSGWKDRYDDREQPKMPERPVDLPETWTWASADQVGRIETGSTPKTSVEEYYGGEYPFYRPGDLEDGFNTTEAEKTLTEKGLKEARPLPEKSILITCIGSIGKSALIRKKGASNQQINAIIPAPSVVPEYVYFVANSPHFQILLEDRASATTMPIINKGKTKTLPFPLPPLAEQKQIVRRVRQRLDKIDEMARHVAQARERLDHLDRSVLAQAFRGELVETEAERARREDRDYETAEELLARVQDEPSSSAEADPSASGESDPGEATVEVDENGQFEMKVVKDGDVDL
jgi:type I restriction enzyme S subunit